MLVNCSETSGQSRVRWWRREKRHQTSIQVPKTHFLLCSICQCLEFGGYGFYFNNVKMLLLNKMLCLKSTLCVCFVFVLHNFPSVCECIPFCTNLAWKGFSGTSCVSAATSLICLPPWPLRTRERAWSLDGLLRRTYRSLWVCGSVSLCGWQAALY